MSSAPFLFFLGALRVVAAPKVEFRQVQIFLDSIAAALGIGILVYSVWHISGELSEFARRQSALEFAVPVLLSLLFLPFMLLFRIWPCLLSQ